MLIQELLDLADWRRRVSRLYAKLRKITKKSPWSAWDLFCSRRDSLFLSHPQSPLDLRQRRTFTGLSYFPYDPRWRLKGRLVSIDTEIERPVVKTILPEGATTYRPVAKVFFTPPGDAETQLTVYWMDGYGGGLFLPFKDATCGKETYGGGRYLYDTIKGADLGTSSEFLLDFNFAYHPSCAYNSRWICPLASQENTLGFAVEAGEKMPKIDRDL